MIEKPAAYDSRHLGSPTIDQSADSVLRRAKTSGGELSERITADPAVLQVEYTLVDKPGVSMTVIHQIRAPGRRDPDRRPILEFSARWSGEIHAAHDQAAIEADLRNAIMRVRDEAEERDRART